MAPNRAIRETYTYRRTAGAQETALTRFYGLPKAHKKGAPRRSIVSLEGTPTYELYKWLFWRLKFLSTDLETMGTSSILTGGLAVKALVPLLRSKYDEMKNLLDHAQILQVLSIGLRTYLTFD
ncbi:unnamed protein product [Dibothriocephalus latus]|uniref:Uncharacterized protein n=1 Tax=Dibothriocephalus latus TaxID=60516 RepID=A0A3P6TYM0_DIBLA|nr:unnamed protein product [Dibothriocephalus latus]